MVEWDGPRSPTGALVTVLFGEELGVPRDAMLTGTGIAPDVLSDPDGDVLAWQELRIIRNLVDAVGDRPGLGIEAGSRFRLSSYGVWGFALVTSPTFRSAIDVAFQFLDLAHPFVTIERRYADGLLQLVLSADVEPELERLVVERDAAAIRVIQRELTDGASMPAWVAFAFPEPEPAVVERFVEHFGVRPRFDAAETVLAIDAVSLDAPLPQANELTLTMALQQCRVVLQARRARSGLSGRVRDLLVAGLPRVREAGEVARELHLADRTLRHRLAAEGTTYRQLLEEVRERLADELLVRGGLPVADVAARLGYVEVSSFSQAFRRWKGVGPRAYLAAGGR